VSCFSFIFFSSLSLSRLTLTRELLLTLLYNYSIPYAPFSKNDKLGRIVDWNAEATQPAAATTSRQTGGKYREPKEAFGASSAGTFAYYHDEDEASFSLVAGGAATKKAGGASAGGLRGSQTRTAANGRTAGRGGAAGQAGRGGARNAAQGGRDARGQQQGRAGGRGAQGGRLGYRDWNKEQRTRDASVNIGSDWQQLEEIEFSRLSKLRLDVDTDEPETL
jgi:translation initiation factor 3 subunit D